MSATFGVPPGTLRILIVDDETIVRDSLAAWFRQDGHQVDVAEGGKDALRLVGAGRRSVKVVPRPGSDSTSIVPWWAVTMP